MTNLAPKKWGYEETAFGEYRVYDGDSEIALVREEKYASLIANAPEVYWLLTEMLKISDLKAQAATEKNDPLFMKALVLQEGADNIARKFLSIIVRAGHKDGEDTLTALQKAEWYLNREIQKAMDKAEPPF